MTDAVRSLARWCSLAIVAEPGLVRSLRLRLAPELDASAEADLWWSPLVQSRTTRGIVLHEHVAAQFRDELRELHQGGDPRPRRAWALVRAHHGGITPAVALEEQIAWLWVSRPDPGPAIEKRLRGALAAMVSEGRTGLAAWAGRAIPRLPKVAREQPSAWYLEQEALAQLPHSSPLGTQPPDEVDLAVLARMTPRVGRTALGIMRTGDLLYLGAVGPSGQSIEVLATDPRVVELTGPAGTASVQVPAGERRQVDVGWGVVSVKTRFGEVYDFSEWDGLDQERERLEVSVVNVYDTPAGAARLGVVVGDDLIATTATAAEDPPQVQFPYSGQRQNSTEVRRRDGLALLRVSHLNASGNLPVRRLRRPPGENRRWHGHPGVVGLISESASANVPGGAILLETRHRAGSLDETAVAGGPVVVDGEVSGLVTAMSPVGGSGGYLLRADWSGLWALLYPESAQASARQWLEALADVVQALCLDLHMGFRPLGEAQPVSGQFTNDQRTILFGLAQAMVSEAVRDIVDAARLLADLSPLSALAGLPAAAVAELAAADPRQPAGPLDLNLRDAVLAELRKQGTSAAQRGDQDLARSVSSLLDPGWRKYRDRLADLNGPGFSRGQDLAGFLAALFRSYQQLFAGVGERYGSQAYRTDYSMAQQSLTVLAPLRAFAVDQVASTIDGQFHLEGRFDELTAVFEWACAELVDAVAGFDLRPQPQVRHLVAQAPERVEAGSRFSVLVRTAIAPAGDASAPLTGLAASATGQDVALVVSAPGLVPAGDLNQNLRVPATGDSEPASFGFTAAAPGRQRVEVAAFAGGTSLAELPVWVSVEPGAAKEGLPPGTAGVSAHAAEPGEVTLQVQRDTDDTYSFQLIGETLYPPARARLAGGPARLAQRVADELVAMAGGYPSGPAPDPAEPGRNRLRDLGAQLWADVIPEELRRQFWGQAERIRSLTIAGDVDVVPWELLYPADGSNDNGFLVEQFPVVRRVSGQTRVTQLALRRAACVVPPGRPNPALDELGTVRARLRPAGQDVVIVDRLDSLLRLLDDTRLFDDVPDLLHFAGSYNVADQRKGEIRLADGPLRPGDLVPAVRRRSLAAAGPLVFFNTCRSPEETLGLVPVAAWAGQFMNAGAGAFIAPSWPVRPGSARTFAGAFYQALVAEGTTLGAAVQRARRAVAREAGDPAWLAYAVYGDPSATIADAGPAPVPAP